MPKYDYRCTACGKVYEKREGFDAPALQACPSCAGQARRVLTAPSIVFKGSGWYKTDSRGSDPAPSSTSAPADSPAASDVSTDSKADIKADTKAEPKTKADTKPTSAPSDAAPAAPAPAAD